MEFKTPSNDIAIQYGQKNINACLAYEKVNFFTLKVLLCGKALATALPRGCMIRQFLFLLVPFARLSLAILEHDFTFHGPWPLIPGILGLDYQSFTSYLSRLPSSTSMPVVPWLQLLWKSFFTAFQLAKSKFSVCR